jgi:hypothetical protein
MGIAMVSDSGRGARVRIICLGVCMRPVMTRGASVGLALTRRTCMRLAVTRRPS